MGRMDCILTSGKVKECMTQDERWTIKYDSVKAFIKENKR